MEIFLERYGESVSVNDTKISAVIRPLQYKSGAKLNLPTEYYDNLHYLYTGPAAQKLSIGDTLAAAKRSYKVKRADTVLMSGEELYVWAVLKALSPDADIEVYLEAGGVKAAVADSYTVEHALFGKVKTKKQKLSIHADLRRSGSRPNPLSNLKKPAEWRIAYHFRTFLFMECPFPISAGGEKSNDQCNCRC